MEELQISYDSFISSFLPDFLSLERIERIVAEAGWTDFGDMCMELTRRGSSTWVASSRTGVDLA
ncbi:hypothetical protein PISMIDRAFT_682970 [Pisolithus microcarpus 441]|uniref:Uncharacterized protein n=1 Tax=Pisolithus microcarpus 441 TaxID=765257 RepID=A0A0C9YSB0_9AGAM|nr:hypothetical protein PISMIDRAFT_682970 [Pisolithus microcarpus 441]